MRRFAFLGLLVLLIATACQRSQFTSEIKTVDSLMAVIDTAQDNFNKVDTTGFKELGQTYAENTGFVENHYKKNNDTIPRDVAMVMANYRDIKKPAKGFNSKHQQIKKELEFSDRQLEDLKHDLENNLLDKNFVDRIIKEEKEAVAKVKDDVSTLQASEKYTREKLSVVGPQVDSLIQVLKSEVQ